MIQMNIKSLKKELLNTYRFQTELHAHTSPASSCSEIDPEDLAVTYKNLGYDIADFPNAYSHYLNEITLPLHTCLTDEDVEYVIAMYKEVLGEYIG